MKTVKISKKYITSYFEKEDLDIFKTELFIYLLGQQKMKYLQLLCIDLPL